MPKVCIQAGHVNIKNNIDPALRSETGAPGEASFTLDIANQVSSELRKRGFEVYQADANANSDPQVTGQDYDFFLAIHYDADSYGTGGGFWGFPAPDADQVNEKSRSLGQLIAQGYFNTTGVKEYSQRQDGNTQYYYMWGALTGPTPCGLLECGVGQHKPDDYDLLQNNRPKVVEGIVRGFCQAFNMLYDLPSPPSPEPPPTPPTPPPPPSDGTPPDSIKSLLIQLIAAIKKWLGY